jgi:chemotaxis methyl-accepting protein methylase
VNWTPNLLIIGSSTGGPKALLEFFGYINIALPFPTVIVNHFPKGDFTNAFCRQLKEKTGANIKEAEADERLKPGHIYLCPGGFHISLRNSLTGLQIKIDDEPHIDGCKPSVDKLFQSAAQLNLKHILGLIFTGMGHDGCLGAKALKAAKHTIFTQSEKSCTIYGMPMEVDKAGLSDGSYDLQEMARKICSSPRTQQSRKIETATEPTQTKQPVLSGPKVAQGMRVVEAVPVEVKEIVKAVPVEVKEIVRHAPKPTVGPKETTQKIDLNISPTEILILQDLIVNKTGNTIYTQSKEYLLIEKVKTFAQKHQIPTFHELLQKLKFKASVLEDFISSITIHESFFFRDIYPYRYLQEIVFPEWDKERGNKNMWSSACANGQELYSMLISLNDYIEENSNSKLNLQNVRFYASDISKSCVDFSSEAIYSSTMTRRGLSSQHLERYFEEVQDKQFRVKEPWRSLPNFKTLNLLESLHSLPKMDCIFCRYTIIYFSDVDQQKAIDVLIDKLNPNGVLIFDPAISLRVTSTKLISIPYERFTLFRKKP